MKIQKLYSIIIEARDQDAFAQQVTIIAQHFGGVTSTIHRGAWTTPEKSVAFETSAEHRVVTDQSAEQVEAFACELGRTFEQHSVLFLEHNFVRPAILECNPPAPASEAPAAPGEDVK